MEILQSGKKRERGTHPKKNTTTTPATKREITRGLWINPVVLSKMPLAGDQDEGKEPRRT